MSELDITVEKKTFFQRLDEKLFQLIDSIQENDIFSKLTESFEGLDEDINKLIVQAVGIFVIILPVLVVLSLYLRSNLLQDELVMKKKLITLTQNIIKEQNSLIATENSVFSNKIFDSEKDILDELQSVANTAGINISTFSASGFEQVSELGNIQRTNFSFTYKDTNLGDLMRIIERLELISKFKLVGTQIRKDPKTGTLSGILSFSHFSKKAEVAEQ